MKTKLCLAALLCIQNLAHSQEKNLKFLDDYTNLYLETNINFSSSTEDSRSDAQAGIGTLGIKFDRKFIYGRILFTVFSKNDKIESEASNDIKIFGSNLLIPSNSSNNVSNFSFLLGTKSFYKFEDVRDDKTIEFFDWRRFGGYGQFSVYNTEWVKDELIMPVTTTVLDLHLTYRLLSLDIEGQNNGRADFFIVGGYSNRRLGGDYGLEGNKALRREFIQTEKRGFDAFNLGARLEISNFFGQVNLTNFGNGNIPGFSGNQAIITLGFNANLNLRAKNRMKGKSSERDNPSTTAYTQDNAEPTSTEKKGNHLKFKEIPINDSLGSFVNQLKKQNFILIKSDRSNAELSGKFASEDASILVKATSKTVYEVSVIFSEKESWQSLISQYLSMKSLLAKKYGDPSSIEKCGQKPDKKSGSELNLLREDKCTYSSIFNGNTEEEGTIKLSISPQAKLILTYTDKTNSLEVENIIYNDL
ncbi:hypothetical protein [Chryseobacterium sp. FH1]|uniref:hypothetical protein n=1 Tax=Chryseobacterium sp. FH1 TaxID=1233951 RepID=UPI0004E449BB|nr:hypothetical protein [Chryseobacterium sp. FH1]KFC19303.1 hypothetical protein IO90_08310 [Chryseobacterium sp. FH1]